MKVVYMGDSITYGQYVDPALRWTSLVDAALERAFADRGVRLETVNSGISGHTTRQGLERFPADVQEHRPDVMTLQFGLNDCNCWDSDRGVPRVSLAAYRANLVEMIERARLFGAREVILSTNHPTLRHSPMVSGETFEQASERYSAAVREVAAQCGVTLCDIRVGFEGYDERELAAMLLPEPDILHLSPEGNRRYAALIEDRVVAAVERCLVDRQGACCAGA